jgi:hypothetical protein
MNFYGKTLAKKALSQFMAVLINLTQSCKNSSNRHFNLIQYQIQVLSQQALVIISSIQMMTTITDRKFGKVDNNNFFNHF